MKQTPKEQDFDKMQCSTIGLLHCEKSFPLLGGRVSIVIYDVDYIMLEGVFDDIFMEGLRLQKIFNFYDKDSELSKLNASRKMIVSQELLEVLKRALEYAQATDGKYDVSTGINIMRRKKGLELIKLGCSYKGIIIKGNLVELRHPDVLIDLGSIAKGYIADKLIEYMKAQGIESAFIDARGEMRNYGIGLEVIQVQHPRDNGKGIHKLVLKNMSIATSGDYKQYCDSYDKCHIVGSKDVVSVTVVAPNLMDADVAATCLFLIGLENIENFMAKNKGFKAFVIDKNLQEHFYNGFEHLLMKEEQKTMGDYHRTYHK
jgi:thiamine biosynthesis lipoprotein